MVIYTVSCLRTGHTVNMYHIKVSRPSCAKKAQNGVGGTRDLVSSPTNLRLEKGKSTDFLRAGWALGSVRIGLESFQLPAFRPHRPARSQSLQ
jgi:hypothetical protein